MSVHLQENHPLQLLHSFAFAQKAAYFAEIRSEDELPDLLQQVKRLSIPLLPIGEGSNLLFSKDYDGCVLRVALGGGHYLEDHNYHYLKVGAGENWHDFVCYCLQQGYDGLENLSLIPGSVGAAPVQNIGAYGVSLSDFFVSLEAYDLQQHKKVTLNASACQFGYRSSLFKQLPDRYLICWLRLRLPKRWQPSLQYKGLRDALAARQDAAPSAQEVAEAVIALRQSKLPEPAKLPNAGSFFKNPVVSLEKFEQLQAQYPSIIGQKQEKIVKLSAAQLIERCGWKGHREGGLGVYEKHALVLVHHGGGSSRALQQLAEKIQASVYARFAISLEPEVRIV